MGYLIIVDIVLIILSYLLIMSRNGRFVLKPSFFFFALFIQAYLIGIMITTIYNPYGLVLEKDKIILFNIVPHLYIFFIALGTFFARFMYRFTRKEINNFNSKKYFVEDSSTSFYLINTIATLLSLILGILYFKNGIPFFAANKELSRVTMIRGGGYFFLAITLMIPLFSLNGWYFSKLKNNKMFSFFYFVTIVIGISLMIFSLFKSPIARLILIVFIYQMLMRKKKINIKKLASPILLISIVVFGFIYFNIGEFSRAYEYFIKRLFLMNSYDLYHVFKFFPDSIDFLAGKALIMDLKALAPGPGISFDGWMYSLIYPMYYQGGINSSIGEIWAELGWLFPIVGLLWGWVLELVFIKFIRKPQTMSGVLFYSFYVFGLGNTSGGITSKTFSFVLPLLICHILFIFGKQLFSTKGKIRYKEINKISTNVID